MSLRWALCERELAFSLGKTQEIGSLGRWDPRLKWGEGVGVCLWPGLFLYGKGRWAGASLVRRLFLDQSGLGRNTAADVRPVWFTIKAICIFFFFNFFLFLYPFPHCWDGAGRGKGGD